MNYTLRKFNHHSPMEIFLRSFLSLLILYSTGLLASALVDNDGTQVYIVYMGEQPLTSELSESDGLSIETLHHNLLNDVLNGSSAPERIVYSYKRSLNGFAARLTEQEKEKLAAKDGIVSIRRSKTYRPLTTRSWDFLGFPQTVKRSLPLEEDIIIGVLDTGVWPESESFSDKGLCLPPKKWKGSCQNITCNNKIIGARFYKGSEKAGLSPRDTEGHGSHTASTAAGQVVENTSLYGLANGSARGAVPSARLAIYKVCWEDGCQEEDILAGFDDAIADGVDVISVSLGQDSASEYFEDTLAIGSFHAMKRGVLTSISAGNSGPELGVVCNVAPWMLSVAASSTDRKMIDKLVLGNNKTILGVSVNTFPAEKRFLPLVIPKNGCRSKDLAGSSYKGKILLCATLGNSTAALLTGAAGLVAVSIDGIAYSFPLPAMEIYQAQYDEIMEYANSTKNPVGIIRKSQTIFDPEAPVIASFSSRGPNLITPGILKPDISAPGIDILAAWSPGASLSGSSDDGREVEYNIISGTSMACPHVTGIAAYVKSFHSKWSPAMIMSALITTASPILSYHPEAELAYGAGEVNPTRAVHPGLVYDASAADYINMLCAQGYNSTQIKIVTGANYSCPDRRRSVSDLNYPTMALRVNPGASFHARFPRTVTNVGTPFSVYTVKTNSGPNLTVHVAPQKLVFSRVYQKLSFTVSVSGSIAVANEIASASIVWSDGKHQVRSPISVYTFEESGQ